MTKKRTMHAFVATFLVGALFAGMRPHEVLSAGPQCACERLFSAGFNFHDCVGTSSLQTELCQAGGASEPCVFTATFSWVPDPITSCAINSPTSGVALPRFGLNYALFFFNAATIPPAPPVAWATLATCASSAAFDWHIVVENQTVIPKTPTSPCSCASGLTYTSVGQEIWHCFL